MADIKYLSRYIACSECDNPAVYTLYNAKHEVIKHLCERCGIDAAFVSAEADFNKKDGE